MKNKDSESISPHCVTSFSSVPKGGDTEAKKKKVKKRERKDTTQTDKNCNQKMVVINESCTLT